MSLYKKLIEKTLRSKESTFCVEDRSRLSWRKEILREFGEWVPIANAGGPTMGTSTTFGYYVGGSPLTNSETGQPITYTASGLGGADALPTTVTIDQGFGDIANVDAPTYNQLSLAGYAPVVPFFRREDYKDVNAMLDASQEYARRVLADIYLGARVDLQQQVERENAERNEMMNKVSSYVSQLGIDINTLQKNGAAFDKNGRLVVLSHDGGSMGLEYSNNRSITIYNPAKDDYGNLHKIEYGGVGAYSSDIGQIGTTTISVGDSVNFWSNVGNVAHFTDFGISHNPNEIGEVLVGDKKVGPKIVGPEIVGPKVVGPKAVGKGYNDLLDKLADTFKVGSAKNVFDYHMNWQKNPTSKPQDVTNLLSASDKKALQKLVNQFSNDRVGVEDSINGNLQHVINQNPGLRNSLGNIDFARGDGAKIVGNNIVIKKAYDFGGIFDIGGAGLVTGSAAAVYGASKMPIRAFTGTDTMNMVVKIPIKKSKSVKESTTWGKIKKYIKDK